MVGEHEQALRAPTFLGGGAAPAVLRRLDQRFVEGLFRDLATDEGRAALEAQRLPGTDKEPVLYLPVHRAFQLVLVEAYCLTPGEPRLDPAKIDSAGLVVRRRVPLGAEQGAAAREKRKGRPWGDRTRYNPPERWMASDGKLRGWLATRDQTERDEDPDPARRERRRTGDPELNALLARLHPQDDPNLAELSTKLFPVPPDICDRLGRTLLFAVVPTTDPERVEEGGRAGRGPNQGGADALDLSDDDLTLLLPPWLRVRNPTAPVPELVRGRKVRAIERAVLDETGKAVSTRGVVQRAVSGGWADLDLPVPGVTTPSKDLTDLSHFVRLFWQALREVDAFGDSDPSRALHAALAAVPVSLPGGARTPLAALLKDGAEVFVLQTPNATVQLPEVWPTLTEGQARAIREAMHACYTAQLKRIAGPLGRFDRHDARYELRAFMRVRRHDGCPPTLVWSDETAMFRLKLWYDGGPDGAVIPAIELPTVSRTFLRNLKPNVSFKVPRSLFNFLRNNTPGDLIEGKGSNNTDGPEFHWICGFNIPIITICAFIVLFIFLVLLHLIFWWLPFVRICIPIPVVKGGPFDPDQD